MTAARGRGKSAALGLAMASAVAFGSVVTGLFGMREFAHLIWVGLPNYRGLVQVNCCSSWF